MAVGFCTVVEDRLGPAQVKIDAVPPTGFVNRDSVPPLQIAPLPDGVAAATEFTVTVVVYIVDGVQPEVPALLLTTNV